MEKTKISWTASFKPDGAMVPGNTFNPWVGCSKVSPGCAMCYAEALMDKRYGRVKWGGDRQRTTSSYWKQPFKWDRQAERDGYRPKVFCGSLCDVFDASVPAEWFVDLIQVVKSTPNLDWLFLTKRIENAWEWFYGERNGRLLPEGEMLPNLWLGATVENQEMAVRRIPILASVPAVVRFLSCEPLLSEINLTDIDGIGKMHWMIGGGESGADARPCSLSWLESLVEQGRANNIPVFVKQLGLRPLDFAGELYPIRTDKGGDLEEMPLNLQVREFPV